jgi:PAS domain S-box-containing protein
MQQPEPTPPADIVATLTARLAAAERALIARDKTIQALVTREKDRMAKPHSTFAAMEENAALQKIVVHKTLELEGQNRKLEETLNAFRETSSLLEVLLENTPVYIYFKDEQSRFVRFSRFLQDAFRQSDPTGLQGKTDFDFFVDSCARESFADEQAILRTGEPIIGKTEKLQYTDGRELWSHTTKMPWRDGKGRIIGTFGISTDLTAMKAAEAELEVAHQRLLETARQAGMAEVATSVLHNVGNVLNSVNVASACVADRVRKSKGATLSRVVGLLREHESDLAAFFTSDLRAKQLPAFLGQLADHLATERAAALQELGQLQKNIEHIKEIVAMQQEYAHVSGVTETLQITDLIEDTLRMNEGSFVRHNLRVVREFAAVPPVTVEKHKVLQILVNLVRNAKQACDATEETDKTMTLRVFNGDGRVKISVSDNGIGIPPENFARIFNHGFTTKKGGHGFGLHSCALAASEMGGSLHMHSDGLGHGATFTIELPVTAEN